MNKFLKYGCLIAAGVIAAYSYKVWNSSQFKDSLKCDEMELTQAKLDIEPIKIDGSNDIWNVKSDSKLTCFKLVFKGEGNRAFPRSSALLTVLCNTIPEGAGNRDDIALKKVLEDNSINLSIDFDDDDMVVTCSCLEQYFDLAMELISDMLTNAHLKSDKIEFSKQAVVTSIQQNMFTPSYLATEKLNNLMYAEDHPYRYSVKEDLEKAKTITKEEVDNIYKKLFNPKNLEATIVSSIDQEKIKAKFSDLVLNLKKSKSCEDFKEVDQKAELAQKGKHEHVELDNPQSNIIFVLPGVLRDSKDIYASMLAVAAFGSTGMISRLAIAVRDNAGLVYRIRAFPVDTDMQSYIKGIADTRPENVKEVITKVKEECKKLRDRGITEDELKLFKVRHFAASIYDSNQSILNFVSDLRNRDVKLSDVNSYLDNLKRVTLKDVNEVIKKIFNPDDIIFVDCGKSIQDKAKEDIKSTDKKEKK